MTTATITDNNNAISKEISDLISDLRADKKSIEQATGEQKEKYEKLNAALDELETKNQKITLDYLENKNKLYEFQNRVENLENVLSKKSINDTKSYKDSLEYKAYKNLVKTWDKNCLDVEETKALRTDIGPSGGYLVPEVFSSELLKKIYEYSDVRRLARVRAIDAKTLNVAVQNGILVAKSEGEMEAATSSQSTYTAETMTAYANTVTTAVTRDQLNFANFDMESEMAQDAMIAFAQWEGNKCLNGTGFKEPEGILKDTRVPTFDTKATGKVSYDDLILLSSKLKTGYNPVYFLSKETLAYLKTEREGSNNGYLVQGNGASVPYTINERPYVVMQDMPKLTGLEGQTSGEIVLGFGDFFRGYSILDAQGLELVKDPYSGKSQRFVEYAWYRYIGGKVVMPEAFVLLTFK